MRPDAMTLEVTLGCAVYGTTDPITLEDGTEVPGEPRVVKISGRFGELDPLSTEDAAVVLPKLAYIFEGLVKEHNGRKEAQLQRLRLQQQAAAQAAARKQAEDAAAEAEPNEFEREYDKARRAGAFDGPVTRDEEASDAE